MIVHVLVYLARTLRIGTADWRPHARTAVAGERGRRIALGAALLAGLIVALATFPAQHAWQREDQDDAGLVVRLDA